MALPTTRDLTLGPASPIPSSVINSLQDQIVGLKFPRTTFPYGSAAFSANPGGLALHAAGQWTFTGASQLVAALGNRFTSGTTVVQVEWAYNRGGAGSFDLKLRKRNIRTGAAAADVDTVTINAGTGWTTTVRAVNLALAADEVWWLDATFSNAANIFGGALVDGSRL